MSVTPNPQATWTPGLPASKEGSSWKVRIGIVLLGLFALGYVIDLFSDDPAPDRTGARNPRPPAERVDTVKPWERLNSAEEKLYNQAPFYRCSPLRGARRPDGVEAAIRCDGTRTQKVDGEKVRGVELHASYYRYAQRRAADAAFDKRLAWLQSGQSGATVKSEEDWCETTQYVPTCFGYDGEVVFYTKNGHSFAEWWAPKGLYAKAERSDTEIGKLERIWWNRW